MKANILGDVRAESDEQMLSQAFVDTPDYRALIESNDRLVVVGRRGTGKSALVKGLRRHWSDDNQVDLLVIAPEEHQGLSLRPLSGLFGTQFRHIRAGMRVAWRHALMMEAVRTKRQHYRFKRQPSSNLLLNRLSEWDSYGRDILSRYSNFLASTINKGATPEDRIGSLANKLMLQDTEDALFSITEQVDRDLIVLIDSLDEGYSPDEIGIGIVDGLIQGVIDISLRRVGVRPFIFLRDNIFRSIQLRDPDYSKNIEGHVLRLHWDEPVLFDFVTRRIQVVFDIRQEASERAWNHVTVGELRNRNGFGNVLRMTLHRPRDILSLLNEAFFGAMRSGNGQISMDHVVAAGRKLSDSRLNDLLHEYGPLFPAIRQLVELFRGRRPEWSVEDISRAVDGIASKADDTVVRQEMLLVYPTVVDALFGIGFLGLRIDDRTFSFCHDGRRRDQPVRVGRALVHPCYWLSLGCVETDGVALNEIYDEYSIKTSRGGESVRKEIIDALVDRLEEINVGKLGSSDFEAWCERAIATCFAKSLRNVTRNPRKTGALRPDIVGTNVGESGCWKRIYDDYGCRQVIFEVKNKLSLDAGDFHQATGYLGNDCGRIVFLITREDQMELRKGKDVERVREIFTQRNNLVVKLTAKFFCRLLRKLQNPRKHDAVDDALHNVLDDYERMYVHGETHKVMSRSAMRREAKRGRSKQG